MRTFIFIPGIFLLLLLAGCGSGGQGDDDNASLNVGESSSSGIVSDANTTPFRADWNTINCADGSCFVFEGYDPKYGFESWITNGVDGSVMMADANKTEGSSDPSAFFRAGDNIYFEARTPAYGKELYVLDPATSRVALVSDMTPGAADSSIYSKTAFKGDLYFTNTVSGHSTLYRTSALGKEPVQIDTGNSFSAFSTTEKWLYYIKDSKVYRTDGQNVEPIDITKPMKIQGTEDTIVMWVKEGASYSDNPTKLFALDDSGTIPQLIETFAYTRYDFRPQILWNENGVVYFNSDTTGFAEESYRVYRFDSNTKKVDIPVSFEYSDGGEYVYDLFAEGDYFYMLTSREYSSSSGYWTPETGAVTEPSGSFDALYRFDRHLGSKTMLHRFDKEALYNDDLREMAHFKDKIYLYDPENKAMNAYDTSVDSYVELADFQYGRGELQKVADTERGVLYSVKDANYTTHVNLLDYTSDAIEAITDFTVHTAQYGDNEFLFFDNKFYFKSNDEHALGTELYSYDMDSKVRQLVKNIDDSTLSSNWMFATYFDDVTLVNTGNALYTTDFTEAGSVSLGSFGPYRHKLYDPYVDPNIHAASEILEKDGKYYISAPDVSGITSLFVTDGSTAYGMLKLWDSGSIRDEIHLLSILGNKLYFRVEGRSDPDDRKLYVLNLSDDSITEMGTDAALFSVLMNKTIIAQMGETLYFGDNNTLAKLELAADGEADTVPIKELNGTIIKAKGDRNGFYFFVKDSAQPQYGDYFGSCDDINTTVEVWFSDGSTAGTKKRYTVTDKNLDFSVVELIDSGLIFVLSRYSLEFDSDFGFCSEVYDYKTYRMAPSDAEPTLMINEWVNAFGKEGNPNVILSNKPALDGSLAGLKYWRYNLSNNEIEALDLSR